MIEPDAAVAMLGSQGAPLVALVALAVLIGAPALVALTLHHRGH